MEYLNQGHDKSLIVLARTGHGCTLEDKFWLQIKAFNYFFLGW